jgi:hypothetical protein
MFITALKDESLPKQVNIRMTNFAPEIKIV